MWDELGVLKERNVIYPEVFKQIEFGDKVFTVYTDIDRFEDYLKKKFPIDIKNIEKFAKLIKKFKNFNPSFDKPYEWWGFKDYFKIFPFLFAYIKYKKMSVERFSNDFKDPFLRKMFPLIFPLPDMPMILMIFNFVIQSMKAAGFPEGGSLAFSKSLEKRYLELGGKINYDNRVNKILVENNRTIGVKLSNGKEYIADIIISCADGYSTIFELLEGKYINEKIRNYYKNFKIIKPLIMLSLGVNQDFSKEPKILHFSLDNPIEIADENHVWLSLFHFCFDKTFAPHGKSVLQVWIETNYEFWEKVYANKEDYENAKKKTEDLIISTLDKRFDGFRSKIEVIDVATPMTWVRYTKNWKGAYQGWIPTTKTFGYIMEKTLPDLENFYMAGQWVEPGGGVPTAAVSGRNIIQIICKKEGQKFKTIK
jgi:phytoene dehydrogenase-like protein